ncbi:MAG TPA: xylan 1,4-beta-xylosidase [Bacteroidales bacterium]|nr:xylan 1,4-beta-xylosidase [Bacteroidales bacterium]
MKKGILFFLGLLLFIGASGQQFPFQNTALSSEERVKDLISRLTLEEKAGLMFDNSEPVPRLGIKRFNWWSEALHGLANNSDVTVFPEPIGMAASFDDELLYNIYDAVSDEVRAKYNEATQKGEENKRFLSLSVWTPNVNIFRDPRWGRGQETYGEDPYLTSRMGVSVVKGLQGPENEKYKKLLACAKHYAVHSGPESSRHYLNLNDVDPRDLWETYLPAFKSLVTEADVRQVMCAYQRLDDEPCCGNTRLLQRILRDEWGFKYVVVSDCGAVSDFYTSHKVSSTPAHAAAKAVLAGTDVECIWEGYTFENLPQSVEKGLILESDIDEHLSKVLAGRFELGEMDPDSLVPWTKLSPSIINNEAHRKLALDMARETITLLQNKNNILPLKKTAGKIAVIGPNADDEEMLWGNYNGTPVRTITILDGIKTKTPARNIVYDKACELVDNNLIESYIPRSAAGNSKGIKATYWNNNSFNGTPVTVQNITGPIKLSVSGKNSFAPGVNTEGFSARFETVYEASDDDELVLRFGGTGLFEIKVNGESLKSYSNWRTVISKVPFRVEKGKKYNIELTLVQQNYWNADIDFNFGKESEINFDPLIRKLQGIDLVIFAGGLSTRIEGEEMPVELPGFKGGDRTDIELPATQRNCIKALKAAGKKVIFINCSGSSVGMLPETENCEAILQAWYAGESGGQAIADVLFGDYNPSGKLPVTFYKSMQQIADFEDYSMKGRTYRFMSDPLFQFGFGLSYTTFSIGNARISNDTGKGGSLELTIPVTNNGKRDGTEIVQVYVRKYGDTDGPLKTLKGFQRVKLNSGATKEITVVLPRNSFEFYDRSTGKMNVIPGEYEVFYGNSSAEKDLKVARVEII